MKQFGGFRFDVAYDVEDFFSGHARELFQGALDELLEQCDPLFDGYLVLLLSG